MLEGGGRGDGKGAGRFAASVVRNESSNATASAGGTLSVVHVAADQHRVNALSIRDIRDLLGAAPFPLIRSKLYRVMPFPKCRSAKCETP